MLETNLMAISHEILPSFWSLTTCLESALYFCDVISGLRTLSYYFSSFKILVRSLVIDPRRRVRKSANRQTVSKISLISQAWQKRSTVGCLQSASRKVLEILLFSVYKPKSLKNKRACLKRTVNFVFAESTRWVYIHVVGKACLLTVGRKSVVKPI